MSVPTTATELIDHILSRFHDTHRQALPGIVRLAQELEARGAAPALADDLDAMAHALEMHMFKEEMRLFPMMEQGGNTLIAQLIDDMQSEHLVHADVVAELERRLADLTVPPGAEAEHAALRGALGKLFEDLAQHMELEDRVLFPMFERWSAS
ncbi:MAG: hemerythrin domain-containing protein [Methyloversatilis sp.]|jgi:regulator of cell morphogenesis and NO signaling|nr:hemerythrin domain-containing protein [Methyloversatilis sp.]